MPLTIDPAASFKQNLALLPPIAGLDRVDLIDADGTVVDSIPNLPGKQGSLAVYHHLGQAYGTLDAAAAQEGLALFAEHTADAQAHPGAHPNIDRLLAIAAGGQALRIVSVPAAA